MGIQLKNIITELNGKDDVEVFDNINSFFPYIQVKEFNSGFNGIVGQINEDKIQYECEVLGLFEKYKVNDLDEALEAVYTFKDRVIEFSKKFPNRKFTYIDVDCFGGTCFYEGFTIENGQILFNQESSQGGHISLLQNINSNFSGGYFEPFTRDFFTKKGEIVGQINDFSISGLWLALKTDYSDISKYYVDGGSNSLILRRHKEYYYYFEGMGDRTIAVTGKIYNETKEIMKEIEDVISISFQGLDYDLTIQIGEESYRYKSKLEKTDKNTTEISSNELPKSEQKDFFINIWRKLTGKNISQDEESTRKPS